MKIFFATSIHGKTKFMKNYQAIIDSVSSYGHVVLAEHIINGDTPDERGYDISIIDSIKKADVLFAEISYPSVSVGYMISLAVQASKPVVVFYSGSEEPHLLKTLEKTNDKLQVIRYSSIDELEIEIPYVLDFAASAQDVRFNFFISPELSTYMDWVAKHNRTPRSVYLRDLIDKDMAKQGEFVAEPE
jgi:hypothetical protein